MPHNEFCVFPDDRVPMRPPAPEGAMNIRLAEFKTYAGGRIRRISFMYFSPSEPVLRKAKGLAEMVTWMDATQEEHLL